MARWRTGFPVESKAGRIVIAGLVCSGDLASENSVLDQADVVKLVDTLS